MSRWKEILTSLEEQGLRRKLRALPGSGGKVRCGEREVLNLSSNDYLDLAGNPRVKRGAMEAVERYGCGASASRLMSGHLDLHEGLEEDLAQLTGMESALVFGSGFLANLGVLTALVGPEDVLFADRLNHASLIDGMRLSGASWHRYRHADADHLDDLLKRHGGRGLRLVVTDSVFSMDGDLAPLGALESVARRHNALLVVDEAHALGVMGPRGGGVCSEANGPRPDLIVGTLSKALGSYGGFVACSSELRDVLINRARSFIYSTALPPACAGAARAALALLRETPDLGERLLQRARRFADALTAAGFNLPRESSQIVPILLGPNSVATALSERLWREGILAVAVRPPTVPVGTARLRLSVTLAHEEADLTRVVTHMTRLVREAEVR